MACAQVGADSTEVIFFIIFPLCNIKSFHHLSYIEGVCHINVCSLTSHLNISLGLHKLFGKYIPEVSLGVC